MLAVLPTPVVLAIALCGAFWWPRRPTALVAGAVAAAVVSLVATAAYRGPGDNAAAAWLLVETVCQLGVIVPVVRRPPARTAFAAGGLVVAAVAVSPLRIGLWLTPPAPAYEVVAVCACLALIAASGVGIGAYLRWLDGERLRAVDAARRAQRMQLARDLHDWLAHEMTGIVLAAQAGGLDAADPAESARAFRQIEESGVRGLDAMDRALRLLRDATDQPSGAPERPATLAEVAAVAERFAASSTADVAIDIDQTAARTRPEIVATVHRVVLESLTNVRRHAPTATAVLVGVRRSGQGVVVEVTDDGDRQRRHARRRGGTGLAGLRTWVEALDGTLSAGPATPTGWSVRAELPT